MELLHLYSYVLVLLQYCLLFFVVMVIAQKTGFRQHWLTDLLLASGVVLSSLYIYLSTDDHAVSANLGWCYERWGLIFGLLLYRFRQPITRWLNDKRKQKIAVMLIICLILGFTYLKWKKDMFMKSENYDYNTQSTYLYYLLNGFPLGISNDVKWVDAPIMQKIEPEIRNRKNVFKSKSEYVYEKIEGENANDYGVLREKNKYNN